MLNIKTLTDTLSGMDLQELQDYATVNKNDPYIVSMALSMANTKKKMDIAKKGQAGMHPQPKVVDQELAQMTPQQMLPEEQGIGMLPAQNMQNFAGGGIVAFDEGGDVPGYAKGKYVKPALPPDLYNYIVEQAKLNNVDPRTALAIADAERGVTVTQGNPNSTAKGIFQITDQPYKGAGGDPAKRDDPYENIRIGTKLLGQNAQLLRNLNKREPTPGELYTTHFLGSSTGSKLLFTDPNTPVKDFLRSTNSKEMTNKILASNPEVLGGSKTVGDVRGWANKTVTKFLPVVPFTTVTAAPEIAKPAPAPAPVVANPAIDQISGKEGRTQAQADALFKKQTQDVKNLFTSSTSPSAAQAQGITALAGGDPMTGFTMPQDVFSPSPEEVRKYAAAKVQAKKVEDVVSQIPGQTVKAPAFKDTNTYFGGVADELGISPEVQRNVANTINATSGFTGPVGGVNRAASTVSKGLEPTAEMIQKAAQAKQVADTVRLLPPAKAGFEGLDAASAATRAGAEQARRMRLLEQDRKAAVGAEQSVEAATKSANIADKTAKEIALAQDAARLNQAKMTGAAQGLAMTQAADKADLFPQGGGVSDLVPKTAPAMAPPLPPGILAPVAGEDIVDKIKEATGASTAELKKQAADSGMDYNSFLTRLGFGLMAGESQYASVNIGKAGLGALDAQLAEQKSKSEAEYRKAIGQHYTKPSSGIQELEWARDPDNIKLLRQIAQAKADPKASAQEALAFLKDNGVILKETDPVLYNALRNKVLGYAVPQVQEVAGTRS